MEVPKLRVFVTHVGHVETLIHVEVRAIALLRGANFAIVLSGFVQAWLCRGSGRSVRCCRERN